MGTLDHLFPPFVSFVAFCKNSQILCLVYSAKTDPIDGKMILAFAKSKALCPMEPPSEACIKLAALLERIGETQP